MRWFAGALILCGAYAASADDGFGYPDWIRMKDSVAMRCRVLSENADEVEVLMSGGQGEERVKIDRTQIEWLQRNSTPKAAQNKGGDRFPAGRAP
ncbi:MAG: hypothetical protein WCP22_13290 [Chlamydiota bacterium]